MSKHYKDSMSCEADRLAREWAKSIYNKTGRIITVSEFHTRFDYEYETLEKDFKITLDKKGNRITNIRNTKTRGL